MPSSKRRLKDKRVFQSRFHCRKLNLTPAQLDPDSLAKRVALNHLTEFPALPHPSPDSVSSFKITEELLNPLTILPLKDKTFWFIDEEPKLQEMSQILQTKTVIGVDVEVDHEYSYFPIITLIQISCDTHDFVVDATTLFRFIAPCLSPIFLDNSIIKLVFGQCDIRELKRDFGLYFSAVIDVQLVHQWVAGDSYQIGLDNFTKIYLDKEVDKTHQGFTFKLRPLPDYALEYARNDSNLLLECWEVLKKRHKEYLLNNYKYEIINEVIMKPFRFPKSVNGAGRQFSKCIKHKMHGPKRDEFAKRYFNPFKTVWNWRQNFGQKHDRPTHEMLNPEKLLRLAVQQPKNVEELEDVVSGARYWEPEWKESLLEAIALGETRETT
ncbi:unnamed protein product [Orchesella dallaii]|uniref:HRDC domain-containing protein n=1 Tax=Orchesella dallaii TaxID=48710 RepID=A0ABP1S3R8_9HEXA